MYPQMPCSNTAAEFNHDVQADDSIRESELNQLALERAATCHDDQDLHELLLAAAYKDGAFMHALCEAFSEILLMGEKATVPAELVQQVEAVATRHFRPQVEELNQ